MTNTLDSSAAVQTWEGSKQYLTVSAPVVLRGSFPGFGWQVVARQPIEVALASSVRLRNSFFVGALLLRALASLIAWLIARKITEPVRQLAESAKVIASGSPPEAVVRSTIGEVASVQEAINDLAADRQWHALASGDHKRQFMTFADALPHLVFQADASGNVEYVNCRWIEMLGPLQGFKLDNLAEYMDEQDRDMFLASWRDCAQRGANLEITSRMKADLMNGHESFRIRAQAVSDREGRLLRWVGTLTNVHQNVLASEKTEAALEQERTTRMEIERLSRMKDDFLATLSHELRTPLNIIGGWAQMLDLRPKGDDYVKQAARIISRNVDIQAKLIADLLDTSAIVAGKISLDAAMLDGVQLVKDLVEPMAELARSKQLEVDVFVPARPILIQADARRFSQIMSNLLANAIKFTAAGGRIAVTVEEKPDQLEIRVSDTGCGIAPDFIPHVFGRFRQQDSSSTRAKAGLGLGLAIAKSLIELHEGTIAVASAGVGKGCTFVLTLPAFANPTRDSAPMLQARPDTLLPSVDGRLGGVRILVTDDEPDARAMMTEMLQAVGAAVSTAASGAEALKALNAGRFDLLICDIGMPEMDGHALIRCVRASNEEFAAIPALALQGYRIKTR
ncbi:MAG: ATPase [Burkholderia sp.]|nr:ATPase [Burkholderia sp.]